MAEEVLMCEGSIETRLDGDHGPPGIYIVALQNTVSLRYTQRLEWCVLYMSEGCIEACSDGDHGLPGIYVVVH